MNAWSKCRQYRSRFWLVFRVALFIVLMLFILRDGLADTSRIGVIKAQVKGYEFNYVAWELDALWQKAKQALLGFSTYYSERESKALVIEYLHTVGQIFDLEAQIEAIYADPAIVDPAAASQQLQRQRDQLEHHRRELQPLVEPIIERQVSSVLQAEGFGTLGQILPPVSFRFVDTPDVLIISPRSVIRQDIFISLKPVSIEERAIIENRVETASPQDSAYVTGTGGVGVWPALIVETRYMAITFEVVAHEWAHHYLFMFPNGLEYLARPETRIINETTATIFGNTIGIKVLERFYADEVAQGLIWVPDYPTLADFYSKTDLVLTDPDVPVATDVRQTADFLLQIGYAAAAQWVLDTAILHPIVDPDLTALSPAAPHVEINRTRITADYLLMLGRIEAAEAFMESRRQVLGMRVLNQAWFAFNGGYQADPGQGGGISLSPGVDVTDPAFLGDPIGPAIHEIMVLTPTAEQFLVALRGVTTRQELIQALIMARARWGKTQ